MKHQKKRKKNRLYYEWQQKKANRSRTLQSSKNRFQERLQQIKIRNGKKISKNQKHTQEKKNYLAQMLTKQRPKFHGNDHTEIKVEFEKIEISDDLYNAALKKMKNKRSGPQEFN